MAGLRNKNAVKFILQVFILSQKHILGVKKVVWCGLDVVWGGLEVVCGVLGWFGVFPRTGPKPVLLLSIFFVIYVSHLSFILVCLVNSLQPCDHLWEKG